MWWFHCERPTVAGDCAGGMGVAVCASADHRRTSVLTWSNRQTAVANMTMKSRPTAAMTGRTFLVVIVSCLFSFFPPSVFSDARPMNLLQSG